MVRSTSNSRARNFTVLDSRRAEKEEKEEADLLGMVKTNISFSGGCSNVWESEKDLHLVARGFPFKPRDERLRFNYTGAGEATSFRDFLLSSPALLKDRTEFRDCLLGIFL